MTETTQVIAKNGFVVWAPELKPDPTRPACPRHSVGDPDDTCVCPEADEFEFVSGDDLPTAECGCGYPIVLTPEGWQHDAAPWFWGDDHEAKPQ